MTRTTPTTPRRRTGFSLLEMTLSLTVLAVVFAAVGSVFVMAAHVMPRPDSAEAASVTQAAALTRIIEDLQQARYVTASSANSVTFVVPDRTGDGRPDRLSYEWSGIAGDPLTLTINGSAPTTVADDVKAFSLVGTSEERTDHVAGANSVSEEVLLFQHDPAVVSGEYSLDSQHTSVGIVFQPSLMPGGIGYTVTRARVRAKQNGSVVGACCVCLFATSGGQPSGSALAEAMLAESSLGAAFAWAELTYADAPMRAASETTALIVERKNGDNAATIEFDSGSGDGLLTRAKTGDPWVSAAGQGMPVEVYGTVTWQSPSVKLTRTVITHAEVSLQLADAPAQTATAHLYCEPGVHSAQWDAGFDATPVGTDMNGDGSDWKAQSGGTPGSFADGWWAVDGLLYTQPTHDFDEPMVVDLEMGATAPSRGGAEFQINADQAGGQAVPLIVRAGRDGAGDHCVKVYDSEAMGTPRLEVTGLGDNPPTIRLLIVPADNAVGLIVNGEPAGSFTYEPVSAGGLPGLAKATEASDGVFGHVSIRVGGTAVVTMPGGQASDSGTPPDNGNGGLVGGLINGLFGR